MLKLNLRNIVGDSVVNGVNNGSFAIPGWKEPILSPPAAVC
jgi:hypothetical protein